MGRIGITYQDVVNAARKIQGLGKIATVDRVRGLLGTGSNSTITRYLQEWKAENGAIASPQGHTLPQELLALMSGLWERLQEKVTQQGLEYQSGSDEKVKAIQLQIAQVQKEKIELQSQIHKLQEALHQKNEENKVINQTLGAEQIERSKSLERVNVLEQYFNEQKSENERLHQLLSHVQKNLEHYQGSIQRLQQEQSIAIEKQRGQYEQEIAVLRQQTSVALGEKEKMTGTLEQTRIEVKKIQQEHEALKNELSRTQEKLNKTEINEGILKDQHDQISKQHEGNIHLLGVKSRELIEMEKKVTIAERQIINLEKIVSQSEDKIQTLRDVHLFAVQEKANFEGQLKQFQTFGKKEKVVG